MANPYETLGVDAKSTQDQIKAAYRKLAKESHPDLNPGNKKAEERFKDISLAYELIGTPEARAKFEKGELDEKMARESRSRRGPFYHETQQGGGRYSSQFGGDEDDLFSPIFSQAGRGQGQAQGRRPPPNLDELYQMDVAFKDSILGTEREIEIPGGKKFLVKIPAGVDSGTKLRFAGKSEQGGDIYVQLNVLPSDVYQRFGKDLEMEFAVSLSQALLGGEVAVPTIDGSILLKIPPLISVGQKLRVGGKGVPSPGGKRGDQIVRLQIKMPTQMDEEFKTAVQAWSKRQETESARVKENL